MVSISQRLARFERQRSTSAVWCQNLAVFAIPYMTIVTIGHRTGVLETIPTFWLLALGIVILAASVILGIRGFYELWSDGRKGGIAAARGVVLATLLLTPFLYLGFRAFVLPPLYDISTDLDSPPEFDNALDDRLEEMNEVREPTEAIKRLQLQAYPQVSARRYRLGAGRVFREIAELVKERDWVILTSDAPSGNAPVDEEGSGLVAKPVTDGRGLPLTVPFPTFRNEAVAKGTNRPLLNAQNVSPVGRTADEENPGEDEPDERYVEAVATSLLFGFESDVVIRVVEEENGTLVDMRSNSRWGPHDLGSNARRIIDFMTDLDAALQGLSRSS